MRKQEQARVSTLSVTWAVRAPYHIQVPHVVASSVFMAVSSPEHCRVPYLCAALAHAVLGFRAEPCHVSDNRTASENAVTLSPFSRYTCAVILSFAEGLVRVRKQSRRTVAVKRAILGYSCNLAKPTVQRSETKCIFS